MSHGILLENENRVKLTKIKGKFIHCMGYSDHDQASQKEKAQDQNVKLYPEEALFMIENVRKCYSF